MNDNNVKDLEELEICADEGRSPKRGEPIIIRVDDDKIVIDKTVTTGREILEKAKREPVDEFLLFQLLKDGMLEEIRLDETVDLSRLGLVRFFSFKSDRSFRFELDGRRYEWGSAYITGNTLKKLAGVDVSQYGVWLEVENRDDRPIADTELVDLQGEGLERFYTGIAQTTAGDDLYFLPMRDNQYLKQNGIQFKMVEDNGQKAIILVDFELPPQRFGFNQANILILFPSGYPDCAPDMFYTYPWLKLKATGTYAQAADQPFQFNETTWQRWSRHNDIWRPGIDGIWTMLQRVRNALKVAA